MQHCETLLSFFQHCANSKAAMLAALIATVVFALLVVCRLFRVVKKTNFL